MNVCSSINKKITIQFTRAGEHEAKYYGFTPGHVQNDNNGFLRPAGCFQFLQSGIKHWKIISTTVTKLSLAAFHCSHQKKKKLV